MIKATELTKNFDEYIALDKLNLQIDKGSLYGLVGTNGSGKSTLLRLISGVYYPDGGTIEIDGAQVFENIPLKDRVFFLSDDLYFLPQCTMNDMAAFYRSVYSGWSDEKFKNYLLHLPLDPKKRISTFSKGMKRQAGLLFALSCQPDVMLLDEAFDGLDPVVRGAFKKVIAEEMADREMTVLVSSHNLRELEDMCDHVGVLHKGKVMLDKEIDELKLGFCKVQAAFKPMVDPVKLEKLEILQMDQTGSLLNLIIKGNRASVLSYLQTLDPIFCEAVPLTLEEVFIHEMEAIGYDYKNILL